MQPTTNESANKTDQLIESLHETMRRQFAEIYTAQRPSFKELQARERQEAVKKIKDILFARLLVRLIKNHSIAGDSEPLEIDLHALLESL